MSHWKMPLVIGALVITVAACCCGSLGALTGQTEFTTGDFADVPAYPGSTQTTESDQAINTMTRLFALVAQEAEWKHYVTTDAQSDVVDWYKNALPDYGWTTASNTSIPTQNGLVYVREDDSSVMLAIFVLPNSQDSSKTDIIVGRVRVSSGD
jgi:hypothetical protein